jgi:broad specificity phosphatase PhoE
MASVSPRSWADGGTTQTWRRFTRRTCGVPSRPEIAFAGCTVPVVQDARLRECNYGALNGMPVAPPREERTRHIDTPYADGQSYRQVLDQMRAFLCDLASRHQGETVLLIAHSVNRWALQCLLDGQTMETLIAAPLAWHPGWRFTVPDGWC